MFIYKTNVPKQGGVNLGIRGLLYPTAVYTLFPSLSFMLWTLSLT